MLTFVTNNDLPIMLFFCDETVNTKIQNALPTTLITSCLLITNLTIRYPKKYMCDNRNKHIIKPLGFRYSILIKKDQAV